MARTPVPGGVEHGVVRPPNQPSAAGNGANNSYLPLSRGTGGVKPSNYGAGGDRRDGSMPLNALPSPVQPPNHRFDVGMAKMPQPPSVIEPGKGAVPVNPWNDSGQPNRAISRAGHRPAASQMNRAEPRHDDKNKTLANALDTWSIRARHLVTMRLAAARAHAEAGQLDAAQRCLIELRVGLVGRHPDDAKGLLGNARAAFYRQNLGTPPTLP